MNIFKNAALIGVFSLTNLFFLAPAQALKVGDKAPAFSVNTHEGTQFELSARKGLWTVLYFYPKAETPGCTTQACAFRDAIKVIRDLKAEVYGVSGDSVADLKTFHEHHKLNFILLSDAKNEVMKAYGAKMPLLNMARRHTFIIDPELVIRDINTDVDPAKDSAAVAAKIKELQTKR